MRKSSIFGIGLVAFVLSGGAEADSERERQERELLRLRSEIAALEQRIGARTLEKFSALSQLRDTELRLAGLAQQVASLRARLGEHERELRILRERRGDLHSELAVHQDNLRNQVVAAHRVGRMQVLQLLLNQQDPGLVSRVMTYATYLNRARLSAIEATRSAVNELTEVLKQIETARAALRRSRAALLDEQRNLQSSRDSRAALVAEIERQLASGGARLQQLREDSARLEELLRSLQELLADIPDAPLVHRPFRNLKGKLPWPAKGKIVKRYNSPRGIGQMKWRGILIAAPNGNNVRAVYHGRVVFADWLPGLGLLAIIDHEDGYMSLYGYNQSLLKDTGDWVEPGDIIATVGDSGGQSNSGVYFEIRESGKPINPRRWLTQRFSQAS
ncbi:MAG: peptidoglycan DD-metalloendopeptidase family protein [Gammaproteobacteria bacterium]|nr:peptidoglycan DD-metalloendopeptidase family protein [Gammaproteobacteria bacterium]